MKKVIKRKKKFNLKEEYKKSWDYIKQSKNFIYIIIAVFFIFFLIGFLVPAPDSIVEQILRFIEELIGKTQGMSPGGLMRFIFFNNLQSSFFGLIFGIFLGVFSIVVALINGYLLGFVVLMNIEIGGIWVLWRLLPHGIFELSAVFISLGLGLKLGTFIFQKDKIHSLIEYLLNSLRVFVLIIIPFLILAAIIETSLIFLLG